MKTNIFAIMSVVMVVIMASCSGYDEDFAPIVPPEQPTNNETTTPNNDETWETVTDDWYNMVNNYTQIESHKKTNKNEYIVNAPFSANLGEDLYFVTEEKTLSAFINLEPANHTNTTYGEKWYSNEENDSIREVKTTQPYKCNFYSRNLVVKNAQAYRLINGQRDVFMMPTVVSSFAGHSSNVEQIERNDSIFDRETIKDSVRIAFANRSDIAPFYVSARTVIDHFVKVKENEPETMPEPSILVDGEITYISNRTASPVFVSESVVNWYEISVVKTTKKTYVVANGNKVSEWDNTEVADVNWTSAVYDAGYTNKWVPANITVDGTGWTYVLQFANGENRVQNVHMNNSLISSLKSFKKDKSAAQTPFLNDAAAVKRTFTDGVMYTVNGQYPYTVGYRF